FELLLKFPAAAEKSAMITVIEFDCRGIRDFFSAMVGVHQHVLAFLGMTIFGIVFAFGSESSKKVSRFVGHGAVGTALGDQGDGLFGVGGPSVGFASVGHFFNEKESQRGSGISLVQKSLRQLLHLDGVCLRRKAIDRGRVRAPKFKENVSLRIPDRVHLAQQGLRISGIPEAYKSLAIADLNRTDGDFHRLFIEYEDFERGIGLVGLWVLGLHSYLVKSHRSVGLDPEDTPRILIESSHRLRR